MLDRLFHLSENRTTVKNEILGGITTFLSMMYILFVNGTILAEAGMPMQGVFIATALSAALSTLFLAFSANLPLAMAPGMSLNSFFVHTICLSMGYHWKEALAITFLSGLVNVLMMSISKFRKSLVMAFPPSLRIASGAGLGLFIAYVGLKNANIISFTITTGHYSLTESSTLVTDASVVPAIVSTLEYPQLIALIAMVILLIFLAREQKTRDRYGALPVSILATTLIGIPLSITRLQSVTMFNSSSLDEFGEIALSFFGKPGLLTLFSSYDTALKTVFLVFILSLTTVLDTVGTMMGVGHVENAPMMLTDEHFQRFNEPGSSTQLDRALFSNSAGGVIAPLLGSSTSVVYLESVTGILAGGRTGLVGVVVSILFLICLPLAGFFRVIPIEAVTPAMVFAGSCLLSQVRKIEWNKLEDAIPAFLIILLIPLTYSILDGFCIGVIAHVIIQCALGRWRAVPIPLYLISFFYIFARAANGFF